jgi:hypothetical protein
MILHIFEKDWKLLRRTVIGVALINCMEPIVRSSTSPFTAMRSFPLTSMLGTISLLATAILVIVVGQQDAIPGLRQDWLVRPIKRTDLLLSKLLFVVLLVQGPIFIVELCQGLAAGFSLSQCLAAPVSHGLWMLLAMDLPILAFAALTRNLTEAIGAGLVVVLGFALFTTSTLGLSQDTTDNTGIAWVTDSVRTLSGVLGAAVVLALQYYRRKTRPARWAYGAAMVVWLVAGLLPWRTAFAIQEHLSPHPASADSIQVAFEPGLGKYRGASEMASYQQPFRMGRDEVEIELFVPVRINGLGEGLMLRADRTIARLTGLDGRAIELGQVGLPRPLLDRPVHQAVRVPEDVYNRMKDQPARLEINYSLTLMKANPTQDMPALSGDRWIPGFGRCATRTNSGGTQIELRCLVPGKPPCAATFLENPRNGQRNPETSGCSPDYGPYLGRLGGDTMTRFGASLPFRDAGGLVNYLVDRSQLKDARVVFRAYCPESHFTRQVVLSDVRLSDWRAE